MVEEIYNTKSYSSVDGSNLERIREKRKIALMCPYCYELFYREIDFDAHMELVNTHEESCRIYNHTYTDYFAVECDNCKAFDVPLIELDANIAPFIRELNLKGYKTEYCCQGGHPNNRGSVTPYIAFAYGTTIDEKYFEGLSEDWYTETTEITNLFIIRTAIGFHPGLFLKELAILVDRLPDISNK